MTHKPGIRIAWNKVSERLCAIHPDGTQAPGVKYASWPDLYMFATDRQQDEADAPAGHGARLYIGPTLAEVAAAFTPESLPEGSYSLRITDSSAELSVTGLDLSGLTEDEAAALEAELYGTLARYATTAPLDA